MHAVIPLAIALVMAVVAGAAVWLVWSVIENLAAARSAKGKGVASAVESESTHNAE